MASFVANSACNGRKPRQLVGSTPFYRNVLLSRMMHDRSRVRYLLAPSGFGKSMLAGSYAQLMHDYQGVFWICGQNPCFLRDLDADTLASELVAQTEDGDLVVIDDLPAMSRSRSRKVWSICHRLLSAGREVIVCSTPQADPFRTYAGSCLGIAPREFLYSDEDYEQMRSRDIDSPRSAKASFLADRVPAIAGKPEGACERFLATYIEEEASAFDVALTFAMVVLERGTLDDLSLALGKAVTPDDISADFTRPFVQVDEFRSEFDASGFPVREVTRSYAPYMRRITSALGFDNPNVLVLRLAKLLVLRRNTERVVQLLVGLSLPAVRAAWLREMQDSLLESGSLVEAEMLYDSLRGTRYRKDWSLLAVSGLRRCLLFPSEEAVNDLIRVAHSSQAPLAVRLKAASVALVTGSDAACAQLIDAFAEVDFDTALPDDASGEVAGLALFWRQRHPLEKPALNADDARPVALAVACCLRAASLGWYKDASFAKISAAAGKVFAGVKDEGGCGIAEILLARQLEHAPKGFRRPLQQMRAAAVFLEALQARLDVQSAVYGQMVHTRAAQDAVRHSDRYARETVGPAVNPPMLNITLFGQFGVKMGDFEPDEASFGRNKVRILLALLTLESGHDLSSDRVSKCLWPDGGSMERKRHNLYTVFSLLKKALTLPGGECPYIRKSMGIVSLDPELVSSDVADLAVLCRRLQFEEPDPDAFLRMAEQVKQLYRGELLPGIDDEPLVLAARREWRDKTVSALVAGATRLAQVDESRAALPIAQYALEIDPSREDCYEIVMSLQADCGQRPAAIDTWFSYCSYIDTHLGLEPAQRLKDLYNRIIGAQPLGAPRPQQEGTEGAPA